MSDATTAVTTRTGTTWLRSHRSGVSILLISVLLVLAGLIKVFSGRSVDSSPHRSSRVVAHGVHIHSLDWGGSGTALVFIPGFGNSAHVFDDFAPRFVPQFRVVGLTRVGFGESDQPESGYDLASRVEQIRAVLDALGISRAVLVGLSGAMS